MLAGTWSEQRLENQSGVPCHRVMAGCAKHLPERPRGPCGLLQSHTATAGSRFHARSAQIFLAAQSGHHRHAQTEPARSPIREGRALCRHPHLPLQEADEAHREEQRAYEQRTAELGEKKSQATSDSAAGSAPGEGEGAKQDPDEPVSPGQQVGASANSGNGHVDKTNLPINTARRIRDKDHLRYVASQPCLICGRTPSHAHHLRFAQPKALSRKVSDEWTVPLCLTHHRVLHSFGDEERWWREKGIDATAHAVRLWYDTRHPRPEWARGSATLKSQ